MKKLLCLFLYSASLFAGSFNLGDIVQVDLSHYDIQVCETNVAQITGIITNETTFYELDGMVCQVSGEVRRFRFYAQEKDLTLIPTKGVTDESAQ